MNAVVVVGAVALVVGLVLGGARDAITDWWYDVTAVIRMVVERVLLAAGAAAVVYVVAAVAFGLPLPGKG